MVVGCGVDVRARDAVGAGVLVDVGVAVSITVGVGSSVGVALGIAVGLGVAVRVEAAARVATDVAVGPAGNGATVGRVVLSHAARTSIPGSGRALAWRCMGTSSGYVEYRDVRYDRDAQWLCISHRHILCQRMVGDNAGGVISEDLS